MFALWLFVFVTAVSTRSPPQIDFNPINIFAIKMLTMTQANEADFGTRNFAIAPVSVWNIFSLLAEGSSGDTFDELAAGLLLPRDLKETQCLHTAAKSLLKSQAIDVILKGQSYLFTQKDTKIHEEFCQAALQYDTAIYTSETSNSTELAHDINLHICLVTFGRILKAINPSDLENLRVVLIDALFFKANWTYPFDVTHTKEEVFYDIHGKAKGLVNMMYHKGPHQTADLDEIGAQILELPYGIGEKYAMLVLLPYEGISVKTLLENMASKPLDWMTSYKIDRNVPVIDVFLPRFKLSTRLDLIPIMRYLGITSIFDKHSAQLPGVSDVPLFVTSSTQNVEFEVTEEGTTAAASTVVGLEDRILRQRFEANKEFVFLIVQKSCNLILFAGTYTEPSTQ